jgi:hypothetical protein
MANPVMLTTALEWRRQAVLWLCIGLFLARVIGQIETVLIEPRWLPPMDDWYSGLLPYPVLLPAQILLLMLMVALVMVQAYGRVSRFAAGRWQRRVRMFALIYFAVMAVRLLVQFARGAPDAIAAGGIPVAFHWILALFFLVLARAPNLSAR